jgi:hypothetical protein
MRKLQGEPTNPMPKMEETRGVGEVEAATSREEVQIDSAHGATLTVVVVLSALLLDRSLGIVEGDWRREKGEEKTVAQSCLRLCVQFREKFRFGDLLAQIDVENGYIMHAGHYFCPNFWTVGKDCHAADHLKPLPNAMPRQDVRHFCKDRHVGLLMDNSHSRSCMGPRQRVTTLRSGPCSTEKASPRWCRLLRLPQSTEIDSKSREITTLAFTKYCPCDAMRRHRHCTSRLPRLSLRATKSTPDGRYIKFASLRCLLTFSHEPLIY